MFKVKVDILECWCFDSLDFDLEVFLVGLVFLDSESPGEGSVLGSDTALGKSTVLFSFFFEFLHLEHVCKALKKHP